MIEEVRQISRADPRPFRARRGIRPGLRPEARPRRHPRGRVLRPDPADDPRRPRSVGARPGDARRDRGAGRAPGGSIEDDARTLADAYRLLRTVEHRVQMVDDAQTHLLAGRARRRSTMSRGCTGLRDGDGAARAARARTSSAPARIFDGLAPDERGRLVQRSRHPARRAGAARASPTPRRAARHVADWRSGKARSLRSPAARQAFEAMLPACCRRSPPAPTRPRAQPPRATSSSGCRAA